MMGMPQSRTLKKSASVITVMYWGASILWRYSAHSENSVLLWSAERAEFALYNVGECKMELQSLICKHPDQDPDQDPDQS